MVERDALRAGLLEVIRDSAAGSGDDQADSGAKTFGREHEQVLMDRVTEAFAAVAGRAARAGLDILLLDLAHGQLLGGFLSPLANRRSEAVPVLA